MTRRSLVRLIAYVSLAASAVAQVYQSDLRAGGDDPAPVGNPYQQALGMQEVRRIGTPQLLEIMLN
jgi:hypothetical protein